MGFQVKLNCTAHWAFVSKPNPLSKKHEVVLGNLSDAAVTNLKGAGIKVKSNPDKPEQGRYITCRSTLPIKVVDQNDEPLTALIGNGSRAIATVGSYEWTFQGRTGTSPALYKLTITELVEVQRREQEPL